MSVVFPALLAAILNCMTLSGGNGSHASQAPLGQTRTLDPLMVSWTSGPPTEPRRKLESRTLTRSSAAGYTTWRGIGSPATRRVGTARCVRLIAESAPDVVKGTN